MINGYSAYPDKTAGLHNNIDKQIEFVFVQDYCAVYAKNLESLEKFKKMLCIGSEQLKC